MVLKSISGVISETFCWCFFFFIVVGFLSVIFHCCIYRITGAGEREIYLARCEEILSKISVSKLHTTWTVLQKRTLINLHYRFWKDDVCFFFSWVSCTQLTSPAVLVCQQAESYICVKTWYLRRSFLYLSIDPNTLKVYNSLYTLWMHFKQWFVKGSFSSLLWLFTHAWKFWSHFFTLLTKLFSILL